MIISMEGETTMRVQLTGKHINITDAIRNQTDAKLSKLDKYFNQEVTAKVSVSAIKNNQKIEVTIPVNRTVIRAEATDLDLYNAMDMVVDKLGRQMRKHKTKLMNKGHDTIRFENIEGYIPLPEETADASIIKRKKFEMRPMSEEEALLQMELLGHNFFAFTHADTDSIAVLYKRKDGHYGILEAE